MPQPLASVRYHVREMCVRKDLQRLMFYGPSDVLDDGRLVTAEWMGVRLAIGNVKAKTGHVLLYVRALEAFGNVWAIAVDALTDRVLFLLENVVHPLGQAWGAQPVALRKLSEVKVTQEDGSVVVIQPDGVEFAWQSGPTSWRAVSVDPAGKHVSDRDGSMEPTSQGIIDFTDETPRFTKDPLDEPIGGTDYNVRMPIVRGDVTLGTAADNRVADGVLIAKGGQVGTLHSGLVEELHVSPNGRHWVGLRRKSETVVSGEIPETVPPLVLADPVPTFRPAGRAIGVGYFFDSTGDPTIPGTLGVQSPVAFDTRDPHDLDVAGMATVQRWAKEAKVPYGLYIDRYGFRPNLVPPGGRAMLFCYPQGNVAPSETIAAAVADMYVCRDAGVPFDLVVATYCQYSGPGVYALTEQQVLGTLGVLWDHAIDLGAGAIWCFAKTRKHDGVLVDGADYWPSFAEAVRRMRAASDDWRAFPKLSPVDEPAPVPDPIPEDPMSTQKQIKVALRRDFSTPRFLSVADDRQSVDARLTDMSDPRTHFEVHVFDQPGIDKPGKFDVGNKVLLRSAQDQVCVAPNFAGNALRTDLNVAGLWEIRKGELENTWDLLVPVAERAVTVDETGRVSIQPYRSSLPSLHGLKLFNAETKKEIVGPF